jgi:hypothetical protein
MSSEFDSFEDIPHRESIESMGSEDASPETAARAPRRPWNTGKSMSREKSKLQSASRRGVNFGSHEETDNSQESVYYSTSMGSISEGAQMPLHQVGSSEQHEDHDESKMTWRDVITANAEYSDRRSKRTKDSVFRKKKSNPPKQGTKKESNDNERRRRKSSDQANGCNFISSIDSCDSVTAVGADSTNKELLDSPNVRSNDCSHDDTIAHLVQMVASNDLLGNDGKNDVPFTDQESEDSMSAYQVGDVTVQSAAMSSGDGYLAEDDDTVFYRSATLPSGGFSALNYEWADNTLESLLQLAATPSEANSILDEDLTDEDAAQVAAQNFAVEHRIFMKSLLDLLSQRERYATEADINDKDTIKSGPLKKASHLVRGIWKVKYVEVRLGLFSYYEDESKDSEEGTLVRKNIVLHADTCTCRAVKVQHNALSVSPGGAIFELKIEGGSTRLWMANSRGERQAWISAIQAATLGKSVTRGERCIDHTSKSGHISDESPYRLDLELYMKVQGEIQQASSRQLYLGSLSELVGKKLNVPIQWIRQQIGGISTDHANIAFREETISRGVNQLWKDLSRDSVRIDHELFVGGSGHSPEMIIGALMRYIIGFDKSSPLSANATDAQKSKYCIRESQALSYARDILLAGNRTRSGGDSYFCVNTLCKSPELAVVVPSSLEAEPWTISFTHIQAEKRGRGDQYYCMNELSGWLKTRSRPQKPWKRRYFVLSEGTLSYFEKASPRPQGLRGQIAVADSTINVAEARNSNGKKENALNEADSLSSSKNFVMSIVGKDGLLDRQILFEDKQKFILWTHSLEAYCVNDDMWEIDHSVSTVRGILQKLLEEIKGSQEPFGDFILGHKSLKDNAGDLGLDSEEVKSLINSASNSGANGRATVLVLVEASTDYKVCTLDPQGDDADDTWA